MKKLLAIILIMIVNLSFAALNKSPIILLHGFSGWDRTEMGGLHYWGGYDDIQETMKARGFDVRTAAVGPLSSNWDRASELFAYIKGGTVDYGEEHAKLHGHERFGKTFEGLYPEWSEENKVHIVGHSMGGLTGRLLIHMLENGVKESSTDNNVSPLFTGGKKWVQSLTTISTPHNGTTLVEGVNTLLPLSEAIIMSAGIMLNGTFDATYDMKLQQWGLSQFENESTADYITRAYYRVSSMNHKKDFCKYDLSREGTAELNSWVKDSSSVYYQSWGTQSTRKSLLGRHRPDFSMSTLFYLTGIQMGTYGFDREWFPNDGIVNTVSMKGPSTSEIYDYDGKLEKGKWFYRGAVRATDHLDIVGLFNITLLSVSDSKLMNWYEYRFKEIVELED